MLKFPLLPRNPRIRRITLVAIAFVVGVGLPWLLFTPINVTPLPITDYARGVPLYSDRDYANAADSPLPTGTRFVQIARHHETPIWLTTGGPVTVYRMLSDANDNADFDDHQAVEGKVEVTGQSCTMTRLVKLELPPGDHRLPSGGPVAACPLLFVSKGEVRAETRYTFLSWLAKRPSAATVKTSG